MLVQEVQAHHFDVRAESEAGRIAHARGRPMVRRYQQFGVSVAWTDSHELSKS